MALNQSRTVGVIAAMLCGVIMPAGAQSAPAVTDRRITAARELENSGQLDAARQLYREIVASTAPTEAIPEALLSLARLAWPVDDPARLGREPVPQGLALEARTQLETLRVKYDRTPQAAEALWRLALLELEPSSPYYDPVDAAAQLRTLTVIAPDSPRVPAALVLAAETESRNGRLTQAASIAFSMLSDHPLALEYCSRAWQVLADADLATPRYGEALSALGRAANCNGPTAPAEVAKARARLIVRQLNRTAGVTVTTPVESAAPLALRDPQLTFDNDGKLWIGSQKDGMLIALRNDRIVEKIPLPGNVASGFDAWSRRWTIVGPRVIAPAGAGEYPLPAGTEPISIAPSGAKLVWIADADTNRVIRVGAGGKIEVTAALPPKAEPIKLLATPEGGVWVLDDKATGALHQIAPTGALQRTISFAGLATRVVDVTRDYLGTLYLLDAKSASVIVVSPDGKPLQTLALPQQGDAAFSRPAALAVDRDGSVAVYDSKRGKIAWLR